MEPPIIQLVRYGQVDDALKILKEKVLTRKTFLNHTGSYLHQFIGLAAREGSIEILRRCMNYGVKVNIGSGYGLHALVGAASRGHDHVIEWLLEPWIEAGRPIEGTEHSDKLNLPQGWLYPSLHKAIQGQHVSTVKILVEKAWADVNAHDKDNLMPLHVAAEPVDKDNPEQMLRYEEIVSILVDAKARVNDFNPLTGTTPLYDAVSRDSREATRKLIDGGADVRTQMVKTRTTVLHLAAEAGYCETLRTMLEHDRLRGMEPCDFDVRDEEKRTPLHAAVYGGNPDCIRLLIKKGLNLASTTDDKTSVLDAIFERVQHPVEFLTEILDEQVSAVDGSGNEVTLDFHLLTPDTTDHDGQRPVSDMTVILALINAIPDKKQMAILQHPLLETFLYRKYLPSLPSDVLVVSVHFLFVSLLWSQVTGFDRTQQFHHGHKDTLLWILSFFITCETVSRTWFRFSTDAGVLHMSLLCASWFISFMNFYFETIVMDDFTTLHPNLYDSSRLQQVSAIIVLCSWINLMVALIRLPIIGDYSYMFFAVMTNVGKVLFSILCLVVSFALSFSILFSNHDQFNTPWKAFAKTLAMITGEYDYDAFFSSTRGNSSTADDATSSGMYGSPLGDFGMIVFLIFVMVTSIALINLLVGLAVYDVQELLKEGRIRQLMKQADSTAPTGFFCSVSKRISRTMELNLKSSSWIPFLDISSDVKKALYELALKNFKRGRGLQKDPPRDDLQDSLAGIQSSLGTLQSSIQKIVIEQQRQNVQIQQIVENRKTKEQRVSK